MSFETTRSNSTLVRGSNIGGSGVVRASKGGHMLAAVWAATRGVEGEDYDEKTDARIPGQFEERFEKAHVGPLVRMGAAERHPGRGRKL